MTAGPSRAVVDQLARVKPYAPLCVAEPLPGHSATCSRTVAATGGVAARRAVTRSRKRQPTSWRRLTSWGRAVLLARTLDGRVRHATGVRRALAGAGTCRCVASARGRCAVRRAEWGPVVLQCRRQSRKPPRDHRLHHRKPTHRHLAGRHGAALDGQLRPRRVRCLSACLGTHRLPHRDPGRRCAHQSDRRAARPGARARGHGGDIRGLVPEPGTGDLSRLRALRNGRVPWPSPAASRASSRGTDNRCPRQQTHPGRRPGRSVRSG